ncbi:hypothetical protein BJ741DRAFT_329265 [Chytriomyces cf. hyalinus JEL632]|nr:hypothetical protein BJ741DRAFT_329265 [Chytriomyces cf. hyalinus JEL632]
MRGGTALHGREMLGIPPGLRMHASAKCLPPPPPNPPETTTHSTKPQHPHSLSPHQTNSMDTSLKIAACFCEQYAAGPGQICVTCIGNQPSLTGKNSTVLFTTLATQCTNPNDPTFSAAAGTIDPIVRDAVVQNVVSPSSASTSVTANNAAVPASVTAKTTSGSVSRWASSAALGAVAAVFVTLL